MAVLAQCLHNKSEVVRFSDGHFISVVTGYSHNNKELLCHL